MNERKFLPTLERFEPSIIDHSIRRELKDCPRRAFYKYWLGKRPVSDSAPYLTWGTSYHKFREVLELSGNFLKAMEEGLAIWEAAYPNGVTGNLDWMNKDRLMRSFGVAFKWWTNEKKQGDIEVIGVEVPFNVELPDQTKTSGRADQIVRWHGQIWGRDFKTTTKDEIFYKRSISPNDQFDRYTYAESVLSGEQVRGQIIEVLFNDKEPKTRRGGLKDYGPLIYSLLATRSQKEIDEWIEEERIHNEILAIYIAEDIWPKNESQCTWCPYHIVCTMQTEEGMISKLEDSNLFKIFIWDNTLASEVKSGTTGAN